MCDEKWMERKQVTDTLKKAKDEADKMIEKAKSAARPERKPETETQPAVANEEVT
jgi:F0F1-type ATP synthase membrane subunit b/b'